MESVGSYKMSSAEATAFFTDPSLIHFVAMFRRPGVQDCCQTLEDTHYPPGTPANDKFKLCVFPWRDINWLIITIPKDDREHMERAARANGLRIADGIPTIIDSSGVQQFPYRGNHIYSLENTPGHPVYENRELKAHLKRLRRQKDWIERMQRGS